MNACFIDNADGEEKCVFNHNEITSCDEAIYLSERGLGKDECQYWRNKDSVMYAHENEVNKAMSRNRLLRDAALMRERINNHQLDLDLTLASSAPIFKGAFGVGIFVRNTNNGND